MGKALEGGKQDFPIECGQGHGESEVRVRTVMIPIPKTGNIFCVYLPTIRPPYHEEKTQPSVFTHNTLELGRERGQERNGSSGLPKAVWPNLSMTPH